MGDEARVALDGHQPGGTRLEQRAGQAARAGADLDHGRPGEVAGGGRDPAQDRGVEQKMLAKPLVGPQPLTAQLVAELGQRRR
jgi:hypothetical protein